MKRNPLAQLLAQPNRNYDGWLRRATREWIVLRTELRRRGEDIPDSLWDSVLVKHRPPRSYSEGE
jgi:hypothetical protein